MCGCSAAAQASDYPNRYIRVIGRTWNRCAGAHHCEEIAKRLKTQVVVESKPTAGGALAMNAVANRCPGWLYDSVGDGCVYDQYRHRPVSIGFAQGVCPPSRTLPTSNMRWS